MRRDVRTTATFVDPGISQMHQLWYTPCMDGSRDMQPILSVMFYRSSAGNEPVRDWLLELTHDDRRSVGQDIKTAQYGWPLGMPLIRKLEPGLWEVRSHVADGVARTLFTVERQTMVLLHGFVKKSQRTPAAELKTAKQRLVELHKE